MAQLLDSSAWANPRHPISTVPAMLDAAARRWPDAPAILAPGRQVLTHAALSVQRNLAASALAKAGLGRGSRIAMALSEGPEFAAALLAVLSCATCAAVNHDLEEAALENLLRALRIDALIAQDGLTVAAMRVARRLGTRVLLLRAHPAEPAGTFTLDPESAGTAVEIEPPSYQNVAMLAHTSGTSGSPKIVPFEQWRLAEGVLNRVDLCAIGQADRALMLTHLYSAMSVRRGLLPSLVSGGSVICPGLLGAADVLDVIEEMSPTHFIAAPATLTAMLEEIDRRGRPPEHCLRFILSGTAALPSSVRQRLEEVLSVPVLAAYGMTETGSIAQMPFPAEPVPAGSVGKPASLQVAVADDAGTLLAPGEVGEIVVRGPECFGGYENDAPANDAAFRDCWFRTGDAGWMDAAGHLYLQGRIKEVINRGGAKVAPSEVEEVLARHPQVIEAAAFPVPHPTLGEDLAAAVVWRGDGPFDEEQLREFALDRLAAYKVPSRIIELEALPRGSLLKIRRTELTRAAADLLRSEYEPPEGGLEQQIAEIFSEVLGLARTGRHDNFFQVGGDSLRAMRAVARLAAIGRTDLTPHLMFRFPTVSSLAQAIREATGAGTERPPPLRALPRRKQSTGR